MTVSVWRIATDATDYTADDLTGEGASRSGGHWNRAGTPVLYASGSIALACLETVVHLGADDLPLNRHLVQFDIPDAVWAAASQLDARKNVGWDAIPVGKISLDAGEAWAASRSSALFVVPSVIVPEEPNILISPLHADAARIRAHKLRRWTYDARLRKDAQRFWKKHPDAEIPLRSWYALASRSDWRRPADVKAAYRNASVVAHNRIVFNVKGYDYRLGNTSWTRAG